jgi:hypothetical protein
LHVNRVPIRRYPLKLAQNWLWMSRNRSISTAAAMSIERTTSANITVTCLYSAGVVAVATAAPHSLQNFEFGGSSVPHDPHTKARRRHSASPLSFRGTIVSPLASPHVPYRRCDPVIG